MELDAVKAEIKRLRAELDAVFLAQIELAPKIAEALAAERKLTIESILRGLRSEEDTQQVRAIIASVGAMLTEEPQ